MPSNQNNNNGSPFPAGLPSWITAKDREVISDRYAGLEKVGEGAMGIVFKGAHRRLEMPVAIKILREGLSHERFLYEGRSLARIRSPHVVTIHDYHILPSGLPVIVMEWVDGGDLYNEMKREGGRIGETRALAWMGQTCQGMLAAAGEHLVHRDLKPGNIMLDRSQKVKVADFGLVRDHGRPSGPSLTSAGTLMGTPLYMSPEQAESPSNVDTRADIYSFGATFYHALTGAPPFEHESVWAILYKHKMEPLISPKSRCPELSDTTSEILERCLAKDPNERFQSFGEVGRQLEPGERSDSPWESFIDEALAEYLSAYQSKREKYLGRFPLDPFSDDYTFPDGQVLRIATGNLVDQKVDAIVSADDEFLTMGGGVSGDIRKGGGQEIFHEARCFVPVRHGRTAVTSAGKLDARFVFHAVTIGASVTRDRDSSGSELSFEAELLLPSRDVIAEIIASCFYHAESLHVKTIAFPLLGTGAGGFSKGVCLDTMFRVLASTFLHRVTGVREVSVIIYDKPYPPFGS